MKLILPGNLTISWEQLDIEQSLFPKDERIAQEIYDYLNVDPSSWRVEYGLKYLLRKLNPQQTEMFMSKVFPSLNVDIQRMVFNNLCIYLSPVLNSDELVDKRIKDNDIGYSPHGIERTKRIAAILRDNNFPGKEEYADILEQFRIYHKQRSQTFGQAGSNLSWAFEKVNALKDKYKVTLDKLDAMIPHIYIVLRNNSMSWEDLCQ